MTQINTGLYATQEGIMSYSKGYDEVIMLIYVLSVCTQCIISLLSEYHSDVTYINTRLLRLFGLAKPFINVCYQSLYTIQVISFSQVLYVLANV